MQFTIAERALSIVHIKNRNYILWLNLKFDINKGNVCDILVNSNLEVMFPCHQ